MIKRLVLELDEKFHKKFKRKAMALGKPMRKILQELLEKWMKQ